MKRDFGLSSPELQRRKEGKNFDKRNKPKERKNTIDPGQVSISAFIEKKLKEKKS